jgi:hypothetical protein
MKRSKRGHPNDKHSDAWWERRFKKFVDPDYYSHDRTLHLQSTLNGGTYRTYEDRKLHKTRIAEA